MPVPVQGKQWATEECGTVVLLDLRCIFIHSVVYAAVEARLIFQELYLKNHFYKGSKSHRVILQARNSYGVVTCLSLDRCSILQACFAISICSNIFGEILSCQFFWKGCWYYYLLIVFLKRCPNQKMIMVSFYVWALKIY